MGDLTRLDREALARGDAAIARRRLEQGIGTRTDHARTAIRRGGRRVRCTVCGWRGKLRTGAGRRLRHVGCPECDGRLHVENWTGFEA